MVFLKQRYAIGILILLAIFMILPVFNVNAGENDNFLITVETDKEVYEVGETVEYLIKVKNISQNEAKDISIIDELPSNIKVINTDGQINGNKISWEKEELLPEEEVALHLSIKLNEVIVTPPVDGNDSDEDTTPPTEDEENSDDDTIPPTESGSDPNDDIVPPTEGDTSGGDTPSKDNENQVPSDVLVSKPDTGYNNFIILIIGIILSGLGYLLYKVNGKKIGKFFILMLLCSVTVIMASQTDVNAEPINVSQEYRHSVKINGENIESKITLVAEIESNTKVPLINAEDIMIYRGDSFNPLDNVSAYDSQDGDITTNIKVIQNDVNTNQVGQYVVIYEVENSQGIIAKKEIIVTVTEKNSLDGMLYWDTDIISVHLINETVKLNIKCEGTDLSPYLNNIDWWIEDTDIYGHGSQIKFNAPNMPGEYILNAKLVVNEQEYTLTKKIIIAEEIIENTEEDTKENLLTGLKVPELDPNDDDDLDGIINKEEEKIGTNPRRKDTDLDGVDDYAEIYIYGTDPLNPDTDGDGIIDGYEVFLGTNLLRFNDKQDIYTKELLFNEHQVSINIIGSVEAIVNAKVEKVADEYLSNTEVILGSIVDITTIGSIDEATLTLSYDIAELNQKVLDENSLSIYYLDEENLELIKLDSSINLETKTVSTKINCFGKYVLGDSSKISVELGPLEIVFVMDMTSSMTENDPQFEGRSIVKDLVASLSRNHRFSIAAFYPGSGIYSELTTDREKFYSYLDKLEGNRDEDETSIGWGIDIGISALYETSNNMYNKVMILFTDGDDYESDRFDTESEIKRAQDMGIKIYTVGFGDELNHELLKRIAKDTSGLYFHSDDSEALKEVLEGVGVSLVPPTIDTQTIQYDSEIKEVKLIATNGFNVYQHGFTFGNFTTKESVETNGTCYGMAAASYLMYLGRMPQIRNKMNVNPHHNTPDMVDYDLSMAGNLDVKTLNVSELHTGSVKAFNEEKGFYEEKPVSYKGKEVEGHILNNQGKEYYKNTGMDMDNWYYNADESKLYQVPTPVSKNISVEELTPYGDFTLQDINVIQSLVWWWGAQTLMPEEDPEEEYIINLSNRFEHRDSAKLNDAIKNNGLIGLLFEKGGHAVVAQALYESLDERNTYYLELYDNNFPGSKRYLQVEVKNEWYDPFGLFTPTVIINSIDYPVSQHGEIYQIEVHNIEALL